MASRRPAPTRAVIFDNDGVLVDSEPIHRVAWEKVFGARGVVVSPADYAWSIGRRDVTFAEVIIKKFNLDDTPEDLRDEKLTHYLKMLAEKATAFEGIPELLRRLAETYRLGIATSAMREAVDIVLPRLGISGPFGAIVTNEDVTRHKPDPQPYLLCAEQLGVEPARCVALEDSVSGIESAGAAGMRVIALTSTFPADQLSGADAVIDSFADTEATVALIDSLGRGPA